MKKKEEEKILDVNATMQGSLIFSDPVNLRINGKFEGNLTVKGHLIIGQSANVTADIAGETITISGRVKGKIKATELVAFTPTAEVYADIQSPVVAIDKGAIFNGQCRMLKGKMSITELSQYLSIAETKIKEWVDKGEIPVEKAGDGLFFDHKEVEEWISQNSR